MQREADAELPSAPLEAVGVGRGIGGIEFPVILPLFPVFRNEAPQTTNIHFGGWITS